MVRLDRDALNGVHLPTAAQASMALIDAIQSYPAEAQVVAMTASFLLLAQHYGLPVQDAFAVTSNVMDAADGRRPEFRAVEDYIHYEL